MNPQWIASIVLAVEQSQSLPMPGGHGTVFERERQAGGAYRDAPTLVARCLVLLGLFADSDELSATDQAFLHFDWQARLGDWFSQRRIDAPIPDGERGLYVVHAAAAIVAT